MEAQELLAEPVQAGAYFGGSIALDGDILVVGAHGEDLPGAANAGAVYLFERQEGRWARSARLTASDAAAGDWFGRWVALEGDTIVVGASSADPLGMEEAGAAYVFERHDGSWIEQAKLVAPDAEAGDLFGTKVAIAGETIIATARHDDHSGQYRAGSAYVFVRGGSGWDFEQKIIPDVPEYRGRFGTDLQLAGDEVLISATKREREYGSIYSFRREGGSWTQRQRWFAPRRERYAEFGNRLALAGGLLLAGASEENVAGLSNSGAAYLHSRQSDGWAHELELTASVPQTEAWFGRSVALSEPVAVVGAASLRAPERPGAAYVFVQQGNAWYELQKLVPGDGTFDDEFGQSAAVAGRMVLVSAWKHDHSTVANAGAVYVFALNQPPVAVCSDVTETAGPDCTADASVDAGSYDPDGDPISLSQVPPGPYSGVTEVELIVEDDHGGSDSCEALVTVDDRSPPMPFCHTPERIVDDGLPKRFTATASDNCGPVSIVVTGYECHRRGLQSHRIDPTPDCVVVGSGDTVTILETGGAGTVISWSLTATDAAGNASSTVCSVETVAPRGVW